VERVVLFHPLQLFQQSFQSKILIFVTFFGTESSSLLLHKHIQQIITKSQYLIKMESFSQDPIEIVFVQVTLEILGSFILFTLSHLIYKGIEIGHPVYAVIFCDIIVTLTSSLINVIILPFVDNYRYTGLANVNNFFCLVFHCCCWCILSILRYLYLVKQSWLDKTFPQLANLRIVSLLSLALLFILNISMGIPS